MLTVTVKFRQGNSHKPTRLVAFTNRGDKVEIPHPGGTDVQAYDAAFRALFDAGHLPSGQYAYGRLKLGRIYTLIIPKEPNILTTPDLETACVQN